MRGLCGPAGGPGWPRGAGRAPGPLLGAREPRQDLAASRSCRAAMAPSSSPASGQLPEPDILQKVLDEHHGKALAFMERHLVGSGGPPEALGKVEEAELDAFWCALSGVFAVAEGLVAVWHDGAAAPVLESLQEPLALFGKLAPTLYALAASQPKDADAKMTQGDRLSWRRIVSSNN